MFYAGSDNGGQRSGHQLGYAWSEDGCNWVRHPLNPILGNLLSWESAGVLNPTVVRDDQGYKLWYGGVEHDELRDRFGNLRGSFPFRALQRRAEHRP